MVATTATYPALCLSWCLIAAFTINPDARALGIAGHPGALSSILLVLSGTVAVGNSVRAVALGLLQTHRFHALVARRRVSTPASVHAVVTELRQLERVTVVDTQEQVAVTIGLLRPSIVISTGLAESLNDAELHAVLAHEQAHVQRRDPLRALLGRLLAAHLWFMPAAQDMRSRARRDYELAADRHAVNVCGRSALAGALLRVLSPVAKPEFVAPFAEPGLLDARIAQLESGQAPRRAPISPLRSAWTAVGVLAFMTAVVGSCLFIPHVCPTQ
ncbi:M56 family metallopeptidase [Saccharopolyspora sp. ID03-671]|uniref:M56 family metallopeptidase n=1 Tax=Saccharopolyspora sp. ID03-671 TaxID=3073066 RepID=UPI00324DF510